MTTDHDRRAFLSLGLGSLAALRLESPVTWGGGAAQPPGSSFPRQDPEVVEELVRVAHTDLARVRQLVDARPALARAAVDWGFGDWEDALGAASHMGRRDIAEVLLARGARPTLFSATMMGQLEVVTAFVTANPGCQRILGPHSIPLLGHARAGGEGARRVREYLEGLGDANGAPAGVALGDEDRNACVGTYVFGPGPTDRLEVASEKGALSITRPGMPFPRGLRHISNREFHPIGAESVRIRFTVTDAGGAVVQVYDPDLVVTARRA